MKNAGGKKNNKLIIGREIKKNGRMQRKGKKKKNAKKGKKDEGKRGENCR